MCWLASLVRTLFVLQVPFVCSICFGYYGPEQAMPQCMVTCRPPLKENGGLWVVARAGAVAKLYIQVCFAVCWSVQNVHCRVAHVLLAQ